jgi:hypothetical protein
MPTEVTVRLDDLDPLLEPEFSGSFLDQSFTMNGSVLTQVMDGELKAGMGVLMKVTGCCSTWASWMASQTFVTTE